MAYTTKGAVKTYLNVSSSGDDDLITVLIARAQAKIDEKTHRTFEGTSATRYYNVLRDVDGNRTLWLDEDLISVTTLTNMADSAGAAETWGSGEYVLLPYNESPKYAIQLLDKSNKDWQYADTPEQSISVEGTWGYTDTPADDIIHATIRLTAYYYRQKDTTVFETTVFPEAGVITVPTGIPKDVRETMEHYRKRDFG